MAEKILEAIDSLRAEEASIQTLFGGLGTKMGTFKAAPSQMLEAQRLIEGARKSRRGLRMMEEALTTSDFPLLFADILDRTLLGYYRETTPTWQSYCHRSTVPDFRNVKRFAVDGAESTLPPVKERGEYREAPLQDKKDEYAVTKFGRRIDLSWETLIDDDLDAFTRTPERLARAARRSEMKFATELFVGKKGPHEKLYKTSFKNIIEHGTEKNPPLSIEGLQAAMLTLAEMKDFDGEPINIDAITLVVPPALTVTAKNILNAQQIWVNNEGGNEKQRLIAENWMKNNVTLQVESYIPIVASEEHGSTSWFLFASPGEGRPAIEMGFLRGYEDPSLYERAPTSRRIGGGGDALESFDDDSYAWRIRHVLGGTRLVETGGFKATVASNGSGA